MFKEIAKRFGTDVWRVAFLATVTFVLLWASSWMGQATGEAMLSPLLSSMAAVVAIAVLSHVTRRVLFMRLDMIEYARKALEHPVASALVFLGVCFVISALIMAQVVLMG